jgi:hypothetical protein
MVDEISRWAPDRTPAQPKRGPEVTPPTFSNVKPGTASKVKVPRFGDQVDATRGQLRGSGLNAAALGAIEAGNAGIDKQRRRSYR